MTRGASDAIIARERARTRPDVPRGMFGMEADLREYRFTAPMYRATVYVPGGAQGDGIAHICIEDSMLAQLNSAEHIHVDATFKVVKLSCNLNFFFFFQFYQQIDIIFRCCILKIFEINEKYVAFEKFYKLVRISQTSEIFSFNLKTA